MSSVLRPVRKRKKVRTLGPVDVIDREEYAELDVDTKVELIRSLVPLGLMHVEELLDAEVTALAGARYARKDASVGGRRHGSNPGTVGLAGQRVPIRVPRIRHVAGSEMPLRSYEALHGERAVNALLLTRVLYGISCRNYEAAAEAIPGAIGLSGSTVSRDFIQASAAKLRELQERDLSGEDVVAVVLDGKTFAEATMVIALGITLAGEKRFLGFVETDTENEKVLTPFLRSLVERGLDVSQGVLVLLDGGKGLRSAVRKAFRDRALVQRCQWHKRENVVSYLAKTEQPSWRQRLQRAYNRPEYDEARAALETLHRELEDRNQSAARSLAEGFDETLTLLGVDHERRDVAQQADRDLAIKVNILDELREMRRFGGDREPHEGRVPHPPRIAVLIGHPAWVVWVRLEARCRRGTLRDRPVRRRTRLGAANEMQLVVEDEQVTRRGALCIRCWLEQLDRVDVEHPTKHLVHRQKCRHPSHRSLRENSDGLSQGACLRRLRAPGSASRPESVCWSEGPACTPRSRPSGSARVRETARRRRRVRTRLPGPHRATHDPHPTCHQPRSTLARYVQWVDAT